MSEEQTWTVLEWGFIDGGLLGALIVCVECGGDNGTCPMCDGDDGTCPMCDGDGTCPMCDGDGQLFQPYQLPNGAEIDLDRDAEIYFHLITKGSGPLSHLDLAEVRRVVGEAPELNLDALTQMAMSNSDEARCRHAGRHVPRMEPQVARNGRRWIASAVEANPPVAEWPMRVTSTRRYWFRFAAVRAARGAARSVDGVWEAIER